MGILSLIGGIFSSVANVASAGINLAATKAQAVAQKYIADSQVKVAAEGTKQVHGQVAGSAQKNNTDITLGDMKYDAYIKIALIAGIVLLGTAVVKKSN